MQNQKIVFTLSLIILFLASLLGGGQGFLGDVIAQLMAVALLIACMFNAQSELKSASANTRILSFSFIAIIIFVPLLQLYPWPSSGEYAIGALHDLQQAGLQITSVSLNKTYGAERALFSLLPAIAIFIACLQLPLNYRYRLLAALAIIIALNIFMGFAQLAQGQGSHLRLYEITNKAEAVGFFANRNHFASLLMMCLPISIAVVAWWAHQRTSRNSISPILIIGGALFCILIVLAIAVARSRAGLLLGVFGGLLTLVAVFALPKRPGMKRILGVITVIGILAAIQFGFSGMLQRLDQGVGDNTRMQIAEIGIEAGKAYAPMGSGLGTFRQAYAPFEMQHDAYDRTVTNHAHNDYVELWLEAGYPALLAMGIFCLLFMATGFRVWWQQKQGDSFDVLLSRAAWIGGFLALLHSCADYPLRTTANMSVFAVLLAIALIPARSKS